MSRTREQKRASLALKEIKKVKDKDKRKCFKTQVRALPSPVVTSGLLGSRAFLEAKKHKTEGSPELIEALERAVESRGFENSPDGTNLLEKLSNGDDIYLRQVTDEVMAYTSWLKRMVEAHYGAD